MNLKKIALVSASFLTFSLGGIYSVGLSDRENAKEALEQNDYKVLRYDGHSIIHKQHGEIFSDKFKVIDPNGKTKEVVVARGLSKDYNIRSIPMDKKDRAPVDKPKYNPFKVPKI